MPIRVEIYGTAGVAIGFVARSGRLRDVLERDLARDLVVDRTTWHPLDGSASQPHGEVTIPLDDILVAVAEDGDDVPVHVQWHDIVVDVGPYRVTGQMSTMPGFDPGRALARPTGEFVLLKEVRIAMLDEPDGPAVEQRAAFVNRYVVDRVAADMMLGFFFPGATMELTGGREQFAAGVARLPADDPVSPGHGVAEVPPPAVAPEAPPSPNLAP